MSKDKQKRKGGKGKTYTLRNLLIVIARKVDPKRYSYGVLGEIFNLNKRTVYDIYQRDRDSAEEILKK